MLVEAVATTHLCAAVLLECSALRFKRDLSGRFTPASCRRLVRSLTMLRRWWLVACRHGEGGTQAGAVAVGRLEVQQTIQLALNAAPMRFDCAVGEIGAASA
jgi:hypothetical protein